MIERKIYKKLVKSLSDKQILVITGMRRVGKTTSLKYLFSKVKSKNKLYLDLENPQHRFIFQEHNYSEIITSLEIEGLDFNKKVYLFLDEIQLLGNALSAIKFLYDHYNIKFVITGSSSFYLKNHFKESLAGRKQLFELWPLDFEEYLIFNGIKTKLPDFEKYRFNKYFNEKFLKLYESYIRYGGFPEVALTKKPDKKEVMLNDILNSYLRFDILFLADFSRSDEIQKIVRLLAERVGSKADYSKISRITGINRHKVKDYILFLESTFFLKLVKPFVKNKDREIAVQPKIYFSDNGLLQILTQPSKGVLLENSIANQLYLKGKINYYAKKSGQEIDFVLNEKTAFEVKLTPTISDVKTLQRRARSIGIEDIYVCGLYFNNIENSDNFIFGGEIY